MTKNNLPLKLSKSHFFYNLLGAEHADVIFLAADYDEYADLTLI
jgi:hypothetical protein